MLSLYAALGVALLRFGMVATWHGGILAGLGVVAWHGGKVTDGPRHGSALAGSPLT